MANVPAAEPNLTQKNWEELWKDPKVFEEFMKYRESREGHEKHSGHDGHRRHGRPHCPGWTGPLLLANLGASAYIISVLSKLSK